MSGTSAYCLIEGDGTNFTILEAFKEPKHKDHLSCHHFLKQTLIEARAHLIAIDAPLSLPRKLYDPHFVPKPREGTGEIINPYLYRYTDYYLFKTFSLRPMPPAGDRIGRLTARCMQLFEDEMIKPIKEKIIEVYPKQIAQALEMVDYKKNPKSVLKCLDAKQEIEDEHLIDALLAAYGAMLIDGGKTTHPPEGELEGWCYPLDL